MSSRSIEQFIELINHPKNLLDDSSFIYNEMFPFVALYALRESLISVHQLGTVLSVWGNLDNILPKTLINSRVVLPRYIPLFTSTGKKNSDAVICLLTCLEPPSKDKLPYLVSKTAPQLLVKIYEQAATLPKSEQGFWLVNNIGRNLRGSIFEAVKYTIGIHFLSSEFGCREDLLPSFGLLQLFLNVAFDAPVTLNPVIGPSSVNDIRLGSSLKIRDFALPFPYNPLPQIADYYYVPRARDFMFHDWYHAIRASRVTLHETNCYIQIGDSLQAIQDKLNEYCIQFTLIHQQHKNLLYAFGRAIEKVPKESQVTVIDYIRHQFNQERAVIITLKKMRKSIGQLKFRLWDMDRGDSGGDLDSDDSRLLEIQRVLNSIQLDLTMISKLPNTIVVNEFLARVVARNVLTILNPEPEFRSFLYTTYNNLFFSVRRSRNIKPIEKTAKGFFYGMLHTLSMDSEVESCRLDL